MEAELTCRTCLETWQWHEKNHPIHPFNNGQAGATAFLKRSAKSPERVSDTPSRVVWPSDPVLRVALMNAGVITPDQLRAAEEQLRGAMGDVLTRGGQGAEGEIQVGTAASVDVGSTSVGSAQVGSQPGHHEV